MTLINNKYARSSYDIIDTYEAGIVLQGSEIKSLRAQSAQLKGAHIKSRNGELFLEGMHVATYKPSATQNHHPEQPRKLLLHKNQIHKIKEKLKTPGITMIPLKIYTKKNLIKAEIALARGKKKHDKRSDMKASDAKRRAERAVKQFM
jgi:SsrA-binding protein